MMLLFLFLAFATLMIWAIRRPNYTIRNAKQVSAQRVNLQAHPFYVEKAEYESYHKAIHFYYELVPLIQQRPKLIEVKYSFLDWCDATFIFETHQVKLLRVVDKIYLIQSDKKLDLDEFEHCIAEIVQRNE